MNQPIKEYRLAVLSGDGIGPEVMKQALKVLTKLEALYHFKVICQKANVGGIAIDLQGKALPEETVEICTQNDAVLFGSVGGPKWESLPIEQQPERAALLPLRKHFDLYANLRPIVIHQSLNETSPLKNSLLSEGIDILILRELTGGIYFGQPKRIESDHGLDTMIYHKKEVVRIAQLAFNLARNRKKKVTSIDKANVLSSMVFWRKTVEEVSRNYPDITFENMYVDNAAMQLVKKPSQFDVILSPNMFGDILSDEASMLTGSLGMLPSASLSESEFGLYEPIGGTAPDIQGKDIANPIAQILSLAMLLEHSFKEMDSSQAIRKAVDQVLSKGYRTSDLFIPEKDQTLVGTNQMGDLITNHLSV